MPNLFNLLILFGILRVFAEDSGPATCYEDCACEESICGIGNAMCCTNCRVTSCQKQASDPCFLNNAMIECPSNNCYKGCTEVITESQTYFEGCVEASCYDYNPKSYYGNCSTAYYYQGPNSLMPIPMDCTSIPVSEVSSGPHCYDSCTPIDCPSGLTSTSSCYLNCVENKCLYNFPYTKCIRSKYAEGNELRNLYMNCERKPLIKEGNGCYRECNLDICPATETGACYRDCEDIKCDESILYRNCNPIAYRDGIKVSTTFMNCTYEEDFPEDRKSECFDSCRKITCPIEYSGDCYTHCIKANCPSTFYYGNCTEIPYEEKGMKMSYVNCTNNVYAVDKNQDRYYDQCDPIDCPSGFPGTLCYLNCILMPRPTTFYYGNCTVVPFLNSGNIEEPCFMKCTNDPFTNQPTDDHCYERCESVPCPFNNAQVCYINCKLMSECPKTFYYGNCTVVPFYRDGVKESFINCTKNPFPVDLDKNRCYEDCHKAPSCPLSMPGEACYVGCIPNDCPETYYYGNCTIIPFLNKENKEKPCFTGCTHDPFIKRPTDELCYGNCKESPCPNAQTKLCYINCEKMENCPDTYYYGNCTVLPFYRDNKEQKSFRGCTNAPFTTDLGNNRCYENCHKAPTCPESMPGDICYVKCDIKTCPTTYYYGNCTVITYYNNGLTPLYIPSYINCTQYPFIDVPEKITCYEDCIPVPCPLAYSIESACYVNCRYAITCPTPITGKRCPDNEYGPYNSVYCLPPPPGYKPDGNNTIVTRCPEENPYSNSFEEPGCQVCPAGFDCSGQLKQCTGNTYSEIGQSKCSTCSSGKVCQDKQTAKDCSLVASNGFCIDSHSKTCSAGFYLSEGECLECSEGKYCPAGTLIELDCPVGHFSIRRASECTICPKGSSCFYPKSLPVDCPANHYSLYGYLTCVQCPTGSICNKDSLPIFCDPGYYIKNGACTECIAGSYCDGVNEIPCEDGYYSLAGASTCSLCPGGKECTKTGLGATCADGTYLEPKINSACKDCKAGSFCTSKNIYSCPKGTYSSAKSTQCLVCNPGHYCSTATTRVACPAGQYSEAGSIACKACPEGFVCLDESGPIKCAEGSYSTADGKSCLKCEPGFACPTSHSSNTHECEEGTFSGQGEAKCDTGNNEIFFNDNKRSSIVTCVKGQYYEDGECKDCPEGNYCPNFDSKPIPCPEDDETGIIIGTYSGVNSVKCTPCPAGYSCDKTKVLTKCNAGYYSTLGSYACTICPKGKYCSDTDRPLVKDCLSGYYQPNEGQTSCILCPAGFECLDKINIYQCPDHYYSLEGWGSCRPCPAGKHCHDKAKPESCPDGTYSMEGDTNCHDCAIGTYCVKEASKPAPCQPGTNQTKPKQTSCLPCPKGSYSTGGDGHCLGCPRGSYCPYDHSFPIPCPLEYYSLENSTSCTKCNQRKYIEEDIQGYLCNFDMGDKTDVCPAGYYCTIDETDEAAFNLIPCPEGTYGTITSARNQTTACKECPAGRYCPFKAMTTSILCPKGSYCEAEAISIIHCPVGTYNPKAGSTSSSDCITCPQGTYCKLGSIEPLPCPLGKVCTNGIAEDIVNKPGSYPSLHGDFNYLQCPEGAYCDGTGTVTLCPPGTYNDLTGSSSASDCRNCSAGTVCVTTGSNKKYGLPCQPGFYCPEGTRYLAEFPCTGNTYSDEYWAISIAVCKGCPAGYVCANGTNRYSNPMTKCLPGYYCEGGLTLMPMKPCPSGTYQPDYGATSESWCSFKCPPGKYCLEGSAAPTGDCEEGHYCNEGSTNPKATVCPVGTYSISKGLESSAGCVTCPEGFYCINTISFVPCPQGTYNNKKGSISIDDCLSCQEGYYCDEEGLADMKECGYGNYSGIGVVSCKMCPTQYYCNTTTTKASDIVSGKVKCQAGYVCPSGTGEYPKSSLKCPKGFYCIMDTVDPIQCPPGTYNPVMGGSSLSSCLPTPAGQYSLRGSSAPTGYCDPGFYCPEGSIRKEMFPCAAKSFRSIPGGASKADCAPCPAGYFCQIGTREPSICPIGYYCDANISAPMKCEAGNFSPSPFLRDISQCIKCWAGRFCSVAGLSLPDGICDPGYFCTEGSTSPTENICSAGGFCPVGSKTPQPCPPGTFSNETGMKSASECYLCTPGNYCIGEVKNGVSGICSPGYYCPEGSSSQYEHAATPGHYTEEGAVEESVCPAGTYTSDYASSSCLKCPAGYYCPTEGNTGIFLECTIEHYCEEGLVEPIPCPSGTYSPIRRLHSASECTKCPPGKVCLRNPDDPILVGITGNCRGGYYCPEGSSVDTQIECPAGFYCPSGSGSPIPCKTGTYSNIVKLSSSLNCKACEPGYYCSRNGLAAPEGKCDSGYYCVGSNTSPRPSNSRCTKGHKCPEGSTKLTICPKGTYQNAEGKGDCMNCPRGYFCPEGSIDYKGANCVEGQVCGNNCTAGYYCPSGTKEEIPCPIGTYSRIVNAFDIAQCTLCDPGRSCPYQHMTEITDYCSGGYYCTRGASSKNKENGTFVVKCPIGYYCPEGSSYKTPCPPGYSCTTLGLSSYTSKCDAGYYCILAATKTKPTNPTEGAICPAGHYCESGASIPVPCPAGTYSAATGGTSLIVCKACDNGYYCDMPGAISKTQKCSAGFYCSVESSVGNTSPQPKGKECPKGYYCQEGTTDKVVCPVNMYQDNIKQSQCKICPAGYWCTSTEKKLCTPDIVKRSFYCPGGKNDVVYCPDGSYTNQKGASTVSDCLKCPAGMYCPTNPSEDEEKINKCPSGYYCVEGTGNAKGTQCSIGHYCPKGSAIELDCPPGHYCDKKGMSDIDLETHLCAEGYYCIGGAISEIPTGTTGKVCPAGYYCPRGITEPQACPPGTYRNIVGGKIETDCFKCSNAKYCKSRAKDTDGESCPAGYYCPEGAAQDKKYPCPEGYMCKEKSMSPELCSSGTYQPLPAQSSCLICPERFYCENFDASDSVTFKICPSGSYCPIQSSSPKPCPKGTYNPLTGLALQNECASCPPGKVCAVQGLSEATVSCAEGYFCLGGVSSVTPTGSTGGLCTIGHYCPSGTISPIACPPGTFNDKTGSKSSLDCEACKARYYCPYRGASSSIYNFGNNQSPYLCSAGYICYAGSNTPRPIDGTKGKKCPIGTYCTKGATEETPCGRYTYNPYEGQESCIKCPAGKYCDAIRLSEYTECPEGYYCPEGTDKIPCPAGTYGPVLSLENRFQCYGCDPGHYCSGGKKKPDGLCNEGYVCSINATVPNPSVNFDWAKPYVSGYCPPGYYCPIGSKAPTPCGLGTYQNNYGSTSCIGCPPGYYCDILGLIDYSKKLCAAGHYCSGSTITKTPFVLEKDGGRLCKEGYYCPEGTVSEVPCPAGTYEPREGSKKCQTCPAGFTCKEGTTSPKECEKHYYCPEGSSVGKLCLSGTYSETTGLQRADQCRLCPSGFYCLDGVKAGSCEAGYYCDAGASKSNDPNKLCPRGHYCEESCTLPRVCPGGTFRLEPGAKKASDCTSCQPGYYCIATVSTPYVCPKGHYCGSDCSSPTPCPIGKYQPELQRIDINSCLDCPVGYLCTKPGIGNLITVSCPAGHYCSDVKEDPSKCPEGTYNNKLAIGTVTGCLTCPEGFYCLTGTVTPIICKEGTICPAGSTKPEDCPPGYYCKYTNVGTRTISLQEYCPPGYYCPGKTILPIKCNNGYYCPKGSAAPIACPPGHAGTNSMMNDDLESSCALCPIGSYSTNDMNLATTCELCTAGYVCSNQTSTAKPIDIVKDGGYECPRGYYCPTGSYEPTPCPAGRFTNEKCAPDLDHCYLCDVNTYGDREAQIGCNTCGPTSTAKPGSTTCSCRGKNRIFHKSDGKCVCKQYYTSVLENDEEDSNYDCRPLIFERCANGYLRDLFGNCVKQDSCDQECGKIGGKRTPGVGVCECNNVQDLDSVCNYTCRHNAVRLNVDHDGYIVFNDSKGIDMTALTNLAGEPFCTVGICKLISVTMNNDGGFTGSYQPLPALIAASKEQRLLSEDKKRLLQVSDSGIQDPIIVVNVEDTVVFSITKTNYPIYLKDSTINTNQEFDYASFIKLKESLQNGEDINLFMYTFNQEGVYVFADNANLSKITIISVMSKDIDYDKDKYIVPITASNLIRTGVIQNEDVGVKSDWVFIGCAFVVILLLIPGVIIFIGYFRNRGWEKKSLAAISFKRENPDEAIKVKSDAQSPNQPLISQKQRIEEVRRDRGEIDPGIFDEIYDQLKEHIEYVKDEVKRKSGQDEENIELAWKDIKELKRYIKDKLKRVASIYGKDLKYKLSKEDTGSKEPAISDINPSLNSQDNTTPKDTNDRILNAAAERQNKNDDDEFAKLNEENNKRNNDVINDFTDEQGKRMDVFNAKILEQSDLNEADKQVLMKEYESQLENMKKLLLLGQNDTDIQLKICLQTRKMKRDQLLAKKKMIAKQKEEIGKEAKDMNKKVDSKLDKAVKDIDFEIDEEIVAKKKDIKTRHDNKTQTTKEHFNKKLSKTNDSKKRIELMDEYKKATESLEFEYEQEKSGQLAKFIQEMEARRKKKKEKLKSEAEKEKEYIGNTYEGQLEELNTQEEVICSKLANEELDDEIQAVKNDAAVKVQEQEQELERIKKMKAAELIKLEKQEAEQLNNTGTEEDKKVAKDKANLDKKIQEACPELTNKRKKLIDELRKGGVSVDRKAAIQAELLVIEADIEGRINEDLKNQRMEFDRLLAARRKQRENSKNSVKTAAIKENTMNERAKVNEKYLLEEKKARKRLLEERFNSSLNELKNRVTEEDLPVAIEKLLEGKHAEEMADLLNEQYRDKSKIMSDKMGVLIEEKLLEMHKVKRNFEDEYRRVKADKDAKKLSDAQYEKRIKDIKDREQEQLGAIELSYIQKCNDLEQELCQSLSEKNQKALLELRETQLNERRRILNEIAMTNRFAKELVESDDKDFENNELREYRRQFLEEHKKKLQDLERKKNMLERIGMENDDKVRAYNEETKLLKEEFAKRERVKAEKDKQKLEERKRTYQNSLKGITDEEKKKMLEDYNRELENYMNTMAEERNRQAEILRKRLEERMLEKDTVDKETQLKIMRYKKAVDNELDDQLKDRKIKVDVKVKPKDEHEKLDNLCKKFSVRRKIFYKKKGLGGFEKIKELEDIDTEAKVKRAIRIEEEREQNDPCVDIDFDTCLKNIEETQKKLNVFAKENFTGLMKGFKKINTQLNDLNKKADKEFA